MDIFSLTSIGVCRTLRPRHNKDLFTSVAYPAAHSNPGASHEDTTASNPSPAMALKLNNKDIDEEKSIFAQATVALDGHTVGTGTLHASSTPENQAHAEWDQGLKKYTIIVLLEPAYLPLPVRKCTYC